MFDEDDAPAHVIDDDPCFDWRNRHDVLSALVQLIGLHGVVLSTMRLGAPWQVANVPTRDPVLHIVGLGTAVIRTPAMDSPVTLRAGDLVMLPRGGAYQIADEDPSDDLGALPAPDRNGGPRCATRMGGRGPRTELTCCTFRFESASAAPLLHLLPELMVVRGTKSSDRVQEYVRALASESRCNEPGTEGTVSRLAELVFLSTLRLHYRTQDVESKGLLAAVAHPQVGRALSLVHTSLDAPWTVATLANKVGMSRTGFAQLFAEKTGLSPIRYIQLCRFEEAKRLLAQTSMQLSEIGQSVGYADPSGFSRAFRREIGLSPRDYRQATRAHGKA